MTRIERAREHIREMECAMEMCACAGIHETPPKALVPPGTILR